MRRVMAEFYDGPHATPAPSEDGPIYLGIGNLREDGLLDLGTIRHISEVDYAVWTRRVEPRPGDVVFTYEASLHRYAIIPEGFRGCLGRRTALIRPDPEVVNTKFLLYSFLSPQWRHGVQQRVNIGSTVDRIPLVDFPNFPITLPDLATQRRIASILSAYDDLIENNTRRIQILEEMAQAIYREWFVEFRFPGHEGLRMVDSALGPIPEGWGVRQLSDVVSTQYGYTESATTEPIGPKFLRGMDMNKASFIDWSEVPYCPILESDISKYRLEIGDVLVIRMADPGKVSMVEIDVDAVFASYLVRLRPFDASLLTPYFLFYMLLADSYQQFARGATTGTTRGSLSAKVMTAFSFALPCEALQEKFTAVIGPIRALLGNMLSQNANLRQTRDLLLPRLISGEIDVSGLDLGDV